MNNNLGLTIATVLLATGLYGQEISKDYIVKYKIRSITTINGDDHVQSIDYYDEIGDLIKVGRMDDDDKPEIWKVFTYDRNKTLIEERFLKNNGEIDKWIKYTYNSSSQLIKKEMIESDNQISATWSYENDANNNRTKETKKSGLIGSGQTVYTYSGKLLTQEETSNETIGKEEKITYKYNDRGQVIEKKAKHFYFNTTITLTYTYDDNARLTQLVEKSSNGVSSKTTYQYDDQGLLISHIWKSSLSKTPSKTRYINQL
jgi:YD repeat-containing protein